MDFFTTLEQCTILPQAEYPLYTQKRDDPIDIVKKEIYENILYATIDEAMHYITSLPNKYPELEYREALQNISEQFEQFKNAYIVYREPCNSATQGLLDTISICELSIKYMQQTGLMYIKNIITVLGIEYTFINNAHRTWLHYAVLWKNENLVQWLVNKTYEQYSLRTIYINIPDEHGHTPLYEAVLLGPIYESIAKIIRNNGGLHGTKRPSMMEIVVHRWSNE